MPIYEYTCRKCHNQFDARVKYEQRLEPQPCPACGARETSLRISAPALVGAASHKGSGGSGGGCCGGGCACGA